MARSRTPPRGWRAFFLSWALLSVLAALWSVATPIGAAPDEPAHLIKAASVARGQLIGESSPSGQIVQVPQYIAFTHAQTCFAFDSEQSADCSLDVPGDPAELVDSTTTAGLYNPLYYTMVGWPSLIFGDEVGIYAMRILSGLISSALIAIAFALVSLWRRPTIPSLGMAVALTPMVLFLNGTVNPNTLEIAAILTTFVSMLTVIRDPDALRIGPLAWIVFASAAIAANSRGLSLLWLVIAIAAPFLLVTGEQFRKLLASRAVRLAVIGVAAAVVFAGIWLLSTNSLGAAIDKPDSPFAAPAVGTSGLFGFVWTLFATFEYAQGMIGIFGWLDTPAPPFVFFVWSALSGALFLAGLVLLRGRVFILTVSLLVAVLLLPPILQGIYIQGGGIIWQGRYILPVFVCAVVAIACLLSERLTLSRTTLVRLVAIVTGLWAFAQLQSFATALRRYAVGLDASWLDLLDPRWAPPGGIWVSLVGFGAVLLASVLAAVVLSARRGKAMGIPRP
jgi:hypothetical protein